MYEMEGPRLVSRRRPADCSASFAPLDHLPGPVAWPAFRSPGTPVAQGSPSRGGSEFLRRSPGVAPKATAQSLVAGWVRVFSPPKARGFPSADGSESLFAGWLRVPPLASDPGLYPSPGGSGCPRAEGPRSSLAGGSGVSPVAGWLGVAPLPVARAVLVPKARGHPFAGGSGPPVPVARNALCRVAPNPPLVTARGCPLTGDLEFPLRRWPGVSPWPGGSGFPLRLLPFPVVRKFLRLSSGPHKRFPPAISRFFRRPQAIHS